MKIKKKWEESKQKELSGISGRIRKKEKKKDEERRKKKTEQRERKKKGKRGFSFISKIYGDRTVGFHRSKRQSSSTQREQSVDTKI